MKNKNDSKMRAEKAQIYNLRFTYLSTINCGPALRAWSDKKLQARFQLFELYLNNNPPSSWFHSKFIASPGVMCGLELQVNQTKSGYKVKVLNGTKENAA